MPLWNLDTEPQRRLPNKVFLLLNYDIYRTEGPIRGQGGTAVTVKSTFTHSPVTINGLIDIQLTVIELYTNTRQRVRKSLY